MRKILYWNILRNPANLCTFVRHNKIKAKDIVAITRKGSELEIWFFSKKYPKTLDKIKSNML